MATRPAIRPQPQPPVAGEAEPEDLRVLGEALLARADEVLERTVRRTARTGIKFDAPAVQVFVNPDDLDRFIIQNFFTEPDNSPP